MKIRLTQPGFETYTGQSGILFFEEGLSTADVSFRDAARVAAVMLCEFEDGTSCSPSQRILDSALVEASSARDTYDEPAPGAVAAPAPAADVLAKVDVDPAKGAAAVVVDETPAPAAATGPAIYTAEELGELADKGGIAALRAIGDPINVKSNSIGGLIAALVNAAAKKE